MRETLVITDLTQMKEADRVCLVGINKIGQCIRPVNKERERGVHKDLLFDRKSLSHGNKPIIYPGGKVEFDFFHIPIELPHMEDHGFNPDSIKSKGYCSEKEWEDILRNSSFDAVYKIFGGLLKYNKWVAPGAKTRSIGTLSTPTLIAMELSGQSVKPRLEFKDSAAQLFNLPVSDKSLWNLCYSAVKREKQDPSQFLAGLFNSLKKVNRIYLRLGLSRPWVYPGSNEPLCYPQVTGLYTFPDYLDGKCWADL